ncbi:N-acetylmuramoyl-L-alanine amidase [Clostridium gasigenes]|uniref:N-acetylmuramoyl-L-alanine amidase n=1 Tax=Clostridium gasigenes TaxID=94869 RepID=UPI001C0C33E0|nr:N-acetylmuramoyl-L-alanine amidase [Clostridium gasigenes]MBU3103007.1 N-acetylmuramoyl-L-alanine amidase [Clostridium gasigenes]
MTIKKIAINMGHPTSGIGTGAVGIVKETDKNREVGNKLIAKLNRYNVEVINCTIDYSSNDMAEACQRANDSGADVFISLHLNAGGGTGVETFYSHYSKQKCIDLAHKINSDLANTNILSPSRRCMDDMDYYGYNLYVLKNTVMDAVLVELGFVDNAKDTDRFNSEIIAETMCKSIVEFYNLDGNSNYVSPQAVPVSPVVQAHQTTGEYVIEDREEYGGTGICTITDPLGIFFYNTRGIGERSGSYECGEWVKYNRVITTNKYVYVSWISASTGIRRYMPVRDRSNGERWASCV